LARSDAVLAASGTVTLQTALYGIPGVACYIAPKLSAAIGRRLVRMDRVILPNALLDREVYPFLFQDAATPQAMADGVAAVLADKSAMTRATEDASLLRDQLRGGATRFETKVGDALAEWFGPRS
jgi:lipid-A-disaccharide synthase